MADDAALDLFTAENSTNAPQELEILSTTGQVYRVVLSDLSLSERTSNGSFISETISDEEVLSARLINDTFVTK